MTRFEGRTALVTGAAGGIGAAIVRMLRAEGARVAVADRDTAGIAAALTALGGLDLLFNNAGSMRRGDVTETSDDDLRLLLAVNVEAPFRLARAAVPIMARAGRLDVLVICAGIMEEALVESMDLAHWERTLRVNLTAPFLLIRAALPHLRASGGAIVSIGSIEGLAANPGHAAYAASKAGLHALTRAVAVDHGAEGVRANAVAPGWIDTDLNVAFVAGQPDPRRFRAGLAGIHTVGRTGGPEEVAALVAWLASPEASFVTGQVWTGGGWRMAKLSLP